MLTTIPIPLELTTLKLACAEIINMDFWWLCYYGWEGGKEKGGLVAVRPGRLFLMWARALSFHTAHVCALQQRKRRRASPNENAHVYAYSARRETEEWLTTQTDSGFFRQPFAWAVCRLRFYFNLHLWWLQTAAAASSLQKPLLSLVISRKQGYYGCQDPQLCMCALRSGVEPRSQMDNSKRVNPTAGTLGDRVLTRTLCLLSPSSPLFASEHLGSTLPFVSMLSSCWAESALRRALFLGPDAHCWSRLSDGHTP